MAYEANNTMNQVFSGRAKVDKSEPSLVEQGYGVGIGHIGGSYVLYMRQLRENANVNNSAIHIGKSINLNTKTPTIVNPTTEFVLGEIPKVLIELHTFINELFVKATWRNKNSEDVILESFYKIPSPYDKYYDWWDLYSVYFIGPENLGKGEYKIMLEAKDIKMNKLISTVEFSVKDNDNNERSSIKASSTKTPSIEALSIKNKDNLTLDNLASLQREKIAYVEN